MNYQNVVPILSHIVFLLLILPHLSLYLHFSFIVAHCTAAPPLSPEDEEFVKLTGGKDTLSFIKFLGMADVEDMISCEALTMEDVTEIW